MTVEEGIAISEEQALVESDLSEHELILQRLILAHETWFNVSRNYEYGGRVFPGYAEFHSHGEKYVLTKRAKLWEVDAHEYLFFASADVLSLDEIQDWIEFMTTKALEKVNPEPNHMNSYISLVLVVNGVDEAAKKAIRKARFHKEFKFGFLGWADLRLAVVDLSKRCVLANAVGGEMRAALESNAGFESSKKNIFKRR